MVTIWLMFQHLWEAYLALFRFGEGVSRMPSRLACENLLSWYQSLGPAVACVLRNSPVDRSRSYTTLATGHRVDATETPLPVKIFLVVIEDLSSLLNYPYLTSELSIYRLDLVVCIGVPQYHRRGIWEEVQVLQACA